MSYTEQIEPVEDTDTSHVDTDDKNVDSDNVDTDDSKEESDVERRERRHKEQIAGWKKKADETESKREQEWTAWIGKDYTRLADLKRIDKSLANKIAASFGYSSAAEAIERMEEGEEPKSSPRDFKDQYKEMRADEYIEELFDKIEDKSLRKSAKEEYENMIEDAKFSADKRKDLAKKAIRLAEIEKKESDKKADGDTRRAEASATSTSTTKSKGATTRESRVNSLLDEIGYKPSK